MLQFNYPLPERKEPTVSSRIEKIESYRRYIDTNAQTITTLERLIANPNDAQNLFRNRCETEQELKDALILRERLKAMWNRALNDLIIR